MTTYDCCFGFGSRPEFFLGSRPVVAWLLSWLPARLVVVGRWSGGAACELRRGRCR